MDLNPKVRSRLVLAIFISTAVLLFAVGYFKLRTQPFGNNPGNNPNYFVIWKSNTSLHYTFTYDPHAADVWRVQSVKMSNSTNAPSLPRPKWIWTN